MDTGVGSITLEVLCILESIVHILLQLRTAESIRGQKTFYSFFKIFALYRENGFYADVLGISPFNLLFLISNNIAPVYISVPLRLLRAILFFNISEMIRNLQLLNYHILAIIDILSSIFYLLLLWHWTSCIWFFINHTIEKDAIMTWEKVNNLQNLPFEHQYVFSIYYVIKLVAGVGSGESYATNILERLISCLIILVGDVLFAVAFGLIAAYAFSLPSEIEELLLQRKKIDEFAESFNLSKAHKERVEDYFSHRRSLNYTPDVYNSVKDNLTVTLAKEIAYEINKPILSPLFKCYGSLSFIKKLSYLLETAHYAPGDYIIHRGEIGKEMYFVVEGCAAFLAADMHTVVKRAKSGQFFEESALYIDRKRNFSVRAETYVCVCVLKRSVIDKLKTKYSTIPEIIQQLTEHYKKEGIMEYSEESDSDEETKNDIISTLQGLKNKASGSNVRNAMSKYAHQQPHRYKTGVLPTSKKNKQPRKLYMEPFMNIKRDRKMTDTHINSYEPLSLHKSLKKLPTSLIKNNMLDEDNSHKQEPEQNANRRNPMTSGEAPKRRLSRLTFGKQLHISNNTGVQFQWSVPKKSD